MSSMPIHPLGGAAAIALTNPRFWHHPISSTFHGRDIFAPVAAHLSLDVPPEEFGPLFRAPLRLPTPRPRIEAGGRLIGHILHIDGFGNLITDIRAEDLGQGVVQIIEIAGYSIQGLSPSYQQAEGLLALMGSAGHLEIALKNGNAAALLGTRVGDKVVIYYAQGSGQT